MIGIQSSYTSSQEYLQQSTKEAIISRVSQAFHSKFTGIHTNRFQAPNYSYIQQRTALPNQSCLMWLGKFHPA
jgi:hypothetical protein